MTTSEPALEFVHLGTKVHIPSKKYSIPDMCKFLIENDVTYCRLNPIAFAEEVRLNLFYIIFFLHKFFFRILN